MKLSGVEPKLQAFFKPAVFFCLELVHARLNHALQRVASMLEQAIYYNLEQLAQMVWKAGSIEAKKARLTEMVNQMKFRGKAAKFIGEIQQMTSIHRLDRFASDLMLCDQDKRIP